MSILIMTLWVFFQVQGLDLPIEKPVFNTGPKVQEPAPAPPVVTPTEVGPPPTLYGQVIPREISSLVYVLDCSGSMGMDAEVQFTDENGVARTGNRMERMKANVFRSIESLPESIRFNIVAYESSVWSWQKNLVPANKPNKVAAQTFVLGLQPSGMTATGPAVVVALGYSPQVILLLTDGQPNVPVFELWGPAGSQLEINWHRNLIRDTNKGRAMINTYGISATGSFKQFCVDVAGDNRGSYVEVP